MEGINFNKMPNCLRKYRRAMGLKQKEVAQILGLKSASVVSRWEKGSCLPHAINILKLALLYRTMVEELFIDLRRSIKDSIHQREEEILKNKKGI
jgi:transcriptional regulator with XRE-family HTH domain